MKLHKYVLTQKYYPVPKSTMFSKVKPLLHVCWREVKEWIMEAAQGTQDINGCPYDGRYDEWVP